MESRFIVAGLFTFVCALQDLTTRTISSAVCFLFACIGAGLSALHGADLFSIVLASIPGFSLLLCAKSGPWIGLGDGLYYLVLSLFMDADHIMLLMVMTLPALAATALVLIAFGKIPNFRKITKIPYLAVVFPVYCGLCIL